GTRLVADLMPGAGGSNPMLFPTSGTTLRFLATDRLGQSLWEISGQKPGVARIANLSSASDGPSSNPHGLVDVEGQLCFFINPELSVFPPTQIWTSDGTETGTRMLQSMQPISVAPVAVADTLYIVGSPQLVSLSDIKLYRLNRATNDLRQLTETAPGGLSALAQTVYFSLNDSELWKARNGSDEITLVKKFAGTITSLQASGGRVF